MDEQLKNKVIVITGGASGIGLNIAGKYLSEGAKTVVLLDINEEQGNAAVEALNKIHGNGKAIFILCDVTTDLETVGESILNSYKTIDVLVNSAGIAVEATPKKMLDINTTALVLWSYKFYEHMRTDKGGSGGTIVNLASIFGFRIASALPVYCASKFAVLAFTRCLGHRDLFNSTGVRVVALCPGFTDTLMTEPLARTTKDSNIPEAFFKVFRSYPFQKVDVVGDAAVKVFKEAKSGTAWLIEGGRPIEEVI